MSDARHSILLSFHRIPAGIPTKWAQTLLVVSSLFLAGSNISSAQPYGLETRQSVGAFLNNTLPPREQSAAWGLVEAFPNLTFEFPVCFTAEPRTNRVYVCEQKGKIYFFTNNSNTTTKTLFLDLSAVTLGVDDSGLFGFVFHPEYGMPGSTNRGYVYIYHNYTPALPGSPSSTTPSYNRLVRYTVPDGSLVANTNSAQVLIQQFDENWWHNGGGLFFGADGFLYLSMGDEGQANDSFNNAQKINSGLFAGVLRIDVDQDPARSHPIRRQPLNGGTIPGGSGWVNSFTTNYYIPNDNPWQDPGGSVLEEFYAIGVRSPHRMTQDPPTGRIWLGDVGQDTMEEVNLIEAGGNYQWSYKEGTAAGPKAKPNPLIGEDKPPAYAYGRTEGNCVIGGYVYRGSEHAAYLFGQYIFGDNGSGSIWAMDYNGELDPPITYLCSTPPGSSYNNLSSFGLDQNGEIYVLVVGTQRKIYKLARTVEQAPPPPALLSQTGVFTNLAALTPNPALIPYTVNTPLWSDGAAKSRWMAIPNNGAPYAANEKISFTTTGAWSFPTGTVFVKHFALPTNETNPSELKRLETRLLALGTNGNWYGLTYKWRADNSDADLLSASLNETNFITTATGIRTQVWYYPSRQDCLRCHTPNAGSVLGPRTCQMNGNLTYPATGISDNQLRTLNHLSLFDTNLNEAVIPNYPRTANITDTNASLELRVRSYLDANCAHCHRPNGVRAFFDARFDTPLNDQAIVGRLPVNDLGITDARIVAPMSPAQSIMHLRMNSVGSIKMPPLAKNLVDDPAVALLTAWINSLPPVVPLPQPWAHQEIGPMGVPGNAAFDYSTRRFTLNATGIDIWSTQDNFGFIYRPIQTNVTITARVVSLANLPSGGIGGVMIRQNLTENSPHVFAGISEANDIQVFRRATTGANTTAVGGAGVAPPYWLRLTRNGNTITAHQSANGTTWGQITSYSLTQTGTVYVGLAYASFDHNTLGAAVFDNVSITGPGINNPPLISPIFPQTINQNTNTSPLAFTIFDQETAAASLTLTATSSVPAVVPVSGIVFGGAGTNRTVTITPATNAFGSTSITLTVSDGTNNITTSFAVNVNPLGTPVTNLSPAITAIGNQVVNEDASTAALAFTINDPETFAADLTLTASSSAPAVVAVPQIIFSGTGSNRTVTISPEPNAFGLTTIGITVSDGTNSALTSFTLEVSPVNDAPVISGITNLTIAEDDSTAPLPFSISDIETPAASLSLLATSSVPSLVASGGINVTGTGENRALTITPEPNAFGLATIGITVSDGTNTAFTSFELTVLPVNDAPVISIITNQIVAEDNSTDALSFMVSDVESAALDLTLTATSSVPSIVALDGIVLAGTETNRTITLTPQTNAFGITTIEITATDGTNSTSTSFDLEVLPVNDPPFISTVANQTILEDTTTGALAFTIEDVETASTSLTLTATSSVPALVGVGGIGFGGTDVNRTITLTPELNAFGLTTITLVVSDGTNMTSTAFDLNIEPVNDAPVISAIANQIILEDTNSAALSFTIDDAETAAASLTLTATSSVPALVGAEGISFDGAGVNRTITLTPATNAFGLTTIDVAVFDGTNSAITSFTLEVLPVNDAPTISAITNQTIAEDTTTEGLAFTINDVETAASALTLSATSSVTALVSLEGIVLGGVTAERIVTISPVTNANGITTITLSVNDGTNEVITAFDLNVQPVNDTPVAGPDLLTRWMTQGASLPLANLLTNDTDVDADLLTITNVAEISLAGAAITTSNNWLFYAPIFGNTNADSFSYIISDGNGGSTTGLVTVAVLPDPAWDDLLQIGFATTNGFSIQLHGLPGFNYTVQYSETLNPPAWHNLTNHTANESGLIEITDPNPGGSSTRFYRAVRGIAP